jgi:hypothetical protein
VDHRIIYPTPDGGLAVITPTGVLPIEEVARKDVPRGVPFRIVAATDLPGDRSRRADWVADFSEPDGHGADYGVGSDVVVRYEGGRIAEAARITNPGDPVPKFVAAPIPDQPEVTARTDRGAGITLRAARADERPA